MILYILISTFSFSARDIAPTSGLTLNPIIIASDAEAKVTSDSVIAPTAAWITFTVTLSFESLSIADFKASTDP